MQRSIGLWGAVVTLVGFVIGASVFLLPGELGALAGPGVIISYGIASVMALFTCLIAAQIGTLFPVSGASFVYSTKMTSPFFGFLMVWLVIAGVSMAIALVAHGFAGYFDVLLPGANKTFIAVTVVLAFGGLNLLGANASVSVQTLMVVLFMAVLLVFSTAGAANINTDLLVPFVPNGYGAVLMVAVPAFFSYAGFSMIIDIGGEIRNPTRTIPLSLLISFLVVWLCYTGVSLAIVGHIPLQELVNNKAPFATVAEILFPGWGSDIVSYTVLAAAATSVNALLLGYSRDVYVLSSAKIFPEIFSRTSKRYGEPHYGVALLMLTSIFCVLIGAKISEYATFIVMALMVGQVLLGVATLRLPKIMPHDLSTAEFKFSPVWHVVIAASLIIFSSFFIVIGALGSPNSAVLLGLFILLGVAFFILRKNFLKSRNIDMESSVIAHIENEKRH